MVEKGINFNFCLGTAYDISSMESVGSSKSFFLWEKYASQNVFSSLNFRMELWHLTNPYFPLWRAFLLLMQFLFWIWVSIFSYKAPTKGHYDHIWALGVANIRVCFMNGSMIEHDVLGITFFSVDILKDMVACWYACTTKKRHICDILGWTNFFLSYLWHFYDDNCDKTRYHHRCGGVLLLWLKIMTENRFFVLGGPEKQLHDILWPSMTEKPW